MKTYNYTVSTCGCSPTLKSPRFINQTAAPTSRPSEYGLLNRAVTKHLKKKKRKNSILLEWQLQHDLRRQIQKQQHWHSMDKLAGLNRSRNQEIKKHIFQKAELQSKNEELKAMMQGPTQREQQLNRQISQMQIEMAKLRSQMQEKQLKYLQAIEKLKSQHYKEMKDFREKYQLQNQIRTIKQTQTYSEGVKYYSPNNASEKLYSPSKAETIYVQGTYRRQESPPKQVITTIRPNASPSSTYYHGDQNRSKDQQTYTNVFSNSQNSIKVNENSSYQVVSPIKRQALTANIAKTVKIDGQQSVNTSKNTTGETYIYKNQASKADTNDQSRRSPQEYRNQAQNYQYRNVSSTIVHQTPYQAQTTTIANQNSRPTTFGTSSQSDAPKVIQAGTISSQGASGGGTGVTNKDIDDIYKRYYLSD